MDSHRLGLRSKRLAADLSQANAARRAGISQQHLSLIERGAMEPSLSTLGRILKALGYRLRVSAEPEHPAAVPLGSLARFNEWEAGQERRIDAEEALAEASAISEFAARYAVEPTQARRRAELIRWQQTLRMIP